MLERYISGGHMSQPVNKKTIPISYTRSPPFIELLIDSIGRGVIFVNVDGIVTFINSPAEDILHVDKGSLIGKKVYMLPLRTPVYKILSENCRDAPVEIAFSGCVYAVLATEVRNRQGRVLGEMTEIWDITAEKKEKRQWEEFVAMVTHDLKSPLTVINGYLQMLKMGIYGELNSKLNAVVEQMEQSGSKLVSMVEDLLGSYRMELGIINLSKEICDIDAIIEVCHDDNLNEAKDKGIELTFKIEKGIPRCFWT
jgi:signal transduction histidine kinase